jgi:Zn-dependent metalloprotease
MGIFWAVSGALAAEKVNLRRASAMLQRFQQVTALQAEETTALHQALGLDQDAALGLVRSSADIAGLTHSRYRQMYQGIPVWGESIVVTKNAQNNVVRLSGTLVTGIAQDVVQVTPAIDAPEALTAMQEVHRRRFAAERGVSAEVQTPWVYNNASSVLVIFVHAGKARLSYAVSFFADVEEEGGQPTRPTFIVDAHTKAILYTFEGLTHAEGTGPGGNRKIGRYRYGTDFETLPVTQARNGKCVMRNAKVKAVNLRHRTIGNAPFRYNCYENTFKTINGAFSPINDAFFFGNVVFNMYRDWYGTAPLTFQLTMRVHYGHRWLCTKNRVCTKKEDSAPKGHERK